MEIFECQTFNLSEEPQCKQPNTNYTLELNTLTVIPSESIFLGIPGDYQKGGGDMQTGHSLTEEKASIWALAHSKGCI